MNFQNCQIDAKLIEKLRGYVFEYAFNNPTKVDIEDVRNRIPENPETVDQTFKIPDLMLKRFLYYASPQFSIKSAFEKYRNFFKFRKVKSISKLTLENTFCSENFQIKTMVDNVFDLSGNTVLVFNMKYYRNFDQSSHLYERLFAFLMEHYDRQFERGQLKGLSMMLNFEGFDFVKHFNMQLAVFSLQLLGYYQGLVQNFFFYKPPPEFQNVFNLLLNANKMLFKDSQVQFLILSYDNFADYIDTSKGVDFENGTFLGYHNCPEECVPFLEFAKNDDLKIKQENIMLMNDFLQEVLKNKKL